MADRTPLARRLRRLLVYPLEALAAAAVYGCFRLLPVDAASAVGGWLGRAIGPRLQVTGRAIRNIERAMPELDEKEVRRIVRAMWDNLGRVMGEFPHIKAIAGATGPGRVELAGADNVAALRAEEGATILLSGHFSNWEVFAASAERIGLSCAQAYRAPNNPITGWLLRRIRGLGDDDMVPKGAAGARKAIEVLGAGKRLGVLVDQKMNDGIKVPFFGHDAMTVAAPAQLALRFKCRRVPAWLERTGKCRFRLTIFPPMELPDTGDRQHDAAAIMARVNTMLEGWIRERPEQWLWLHNRWPD